MTYHYEIVIVTIGPDERRHEFLAEIFYEFTPDFDAMARRPAIYEDRGFHGENREDCKFKTTIAGKFKEDPAVLAKFKKDIDALVQKYYGEVAGHLEIKLEDRVIHKKEFFPPNP